MSDSSQHDHIWNRLDRHGTHHSLRWNVVHIGFWSTIILTAQMFFNIFIPRAYAEIYVWIGVIYLVAQLAEFAARDPLNWSEVAEGHLFSVVPAIFGLLLWLLNALLSRPFLTPIGLATLHFWLAISVICFIFGLIMATRTLTAPYSRNETEHREPQN